VKNNQRLGYQRLAEELVAQHRLERDVAREILEHAAQDGPDFPDALVEGGFLTDWELSRTVCELYNLPFLTTEMARPASAAMEGLDPFFLMRHCLVPLCRNGRLLTVLMPGIAPAEVLAQLSTDSGYTILPIVGTVRTNRAWINEHMQQYTKAPVEMDPQWSALFDEADAAVLSSLEIGEEGLPEDGDLFAGPGSSGEQAA
jgi:hypothetical protein